MEVVFKADRQFTEHIGPTTGGSAMVCPRKGAHRCMEVTISAGDSSALDPGRQKRQHET